MQKSREVPVRLLVFVYPTSPFDVGGEFAIGVVSIARARGIIVIGSQHRHCCTVQSVAVLSVILMRRVRDKFVVYLEEI